MKLLCTGIDISCYVDSLPKVHATFLIPASPHDIDLVAEMVGKTIAIIGGNKIELVKASPEGKVRCFYCAQQNKEDVLDCQKCGAPL